MNRFEFRLQEVLKLRTAQRDEKRHLLAQACQAELQLRQGSQALSAELEEIRSQVRAATQPGQIDVRWLMAANRHEQSTCARKQQIDQQLQQAVAQVELCRDQLVEADKQVKVLEKLRERQQAEHLQRAQSEGQRQQDELVSGHLAVRQVASQMAPTKRSVD